MNEPTKEQGNEASSKYFAELELHWQDARAQRQRAAQLFHSGEWDNSDDEDWDD